MGRVSGDVGEENGEREEKMSPNKGQRAPFPQNQNPWDDFEMSQGIVDDYISELIEKHITGQAREHAYRAAFEKLIRALKPELKSINDPRRSEHGAPDFVFLNKEETVGYAETKDVTVKLDNAEKSSQLERYYGYPNLILTNYLEFRFFKNGIPQGEPISIGVLSNDIIVPKPQYYGRLETALVNALSAPGAIRSGKHLSKVMGVKAQRIRDNVRAYLEHPESERNRELMKMHDIIKRLLVHDLSSSRFADLYAQTLVYGLFIARYHDDTPRTFSRQEARELVPKSNPFLHDFFDHVAGNSFDTRLAWAVDELCEVFRVSDVHKLMHEFYKVQNLWGETEESMDPVIHFYEDFLKEYDAQQRLELGVFYTPLPVVRFIVRSVDELLKRDFGITKGLADNTAIPKGRHKGMQRVQVLDPAVGTGTFLKETIDHIYKQFKGQAGNWDSYVNSSLLQRLHGFEIMMASYIIAHLKLAMTLQDTGYNSSEKRLQVYLTNSLEEAPEKQPELFGNIGLQESLTREAIEAGNIKRDLPVMVVIGNPPYSGISQNKGPWITKLIADYKKVNGAELGERKHWLNDDYVKFIRLAEDFVYRTGEGIVGMITNHGYLDNPTFRGMRWHLMQTFDQIYVLDLHGNAKKKEIADDGTKDENVFDIQQGVSILLAVKITVKTKGSAKIYRGDIKGSRQRKYDYLNTNSVSSIEWREVVPEKPNYLFVPEMDKDLQKEYEKGFALGDLFKTKVSGIVTARDALVIDTSKELLSHRISRFADSTRIDADVRQEFFGKKKAGKYQPGDTRGWKLDEARKGIAGNDHQEFVRPIAYRPFDTRWIYYHPKMVDWGREKLMSNFLEKENLGIVCVRQVKTGNTFQHVFITDSIVESTLISNRTSEIDYVYPLYVFDEQGRNSNLNQKITKQVEKISGKTSPENILNYVYATLHSPSYRGKFTGLLKRDFPRVSYPKNRDQFHTLAKFGKELRELHLLRDPVVEKFITTYPEKGSNTVEKIRRDGDRVYVNKSQYFGDVPDEAYNFLIGAYQPAEKYLKDRIGDALTSHDIEQYQKMIVALAETNRIMREIDKVMS